MDNQDPRYSLCFDCAKHEALKRMVAQTAVASSRCAICGRSPSSDPKHFSALSSVIRALVRFTYDEIEYNIHFGGERLEVMLLEDNSILETRSGAGITRHDEDIEAFLMDAFDPPYLDHDQGISMYAGYSDGEQNSLLRAISRSQSPILRSIAIRLLSENYLELDGYLEAIIKQFPTDIDSSIQDGELWYRARIGTAKRFQKLLLNMRSEVVHQPFLGTEIGAPPPMRASAGRANRQGVSHLYLSSDDTTAAAEVRPHPGHILSIGAFRAKRKLRVADFGAIKIAGYASSDALLELFHLGLSIDHAMSMPVTPEERERYNVMQLVADAVRKLGYDGIRFRSSIASGANVCIFRPNEFQAVPDLTKVLRVASLNYSFVPEERVLSSSSDLYEIK